MTSVTVAEGYEEENLKASDILLSDTMRGEGPDGETGNGDFFFITTGADEPEMRPDGGGGYDYYGLTLKSGESGDMLEVIDAPGGTTSVSRAVQGKVREIWFKYELQ